jgi:hypothetical protein
MLFLDGVGIGKNDPGVNPFFAARIPVLRSLFNGDFPSLRHRHVSSHNASFVPLDATLGIEGLPQSGTGQTALFTGVNGPKLVGRHFGPHPYSTLKPIIRDVNILNQLRECGRTVCFANAFPQRFFDYLKGRNPRLTVTTLSCVMTGVPLRGLADLERGAGVSADITNEGWPALGHSHIAPVEPAEAGRRLARLAAAYDFVLFEYWKTDKAGHSQNMDDAVDTLERFDSMLEGLVETLVVTNTLLCITSDHGNIEDMSTKSHTRNPVPAILYGCRHREVAGRLRPRSGRIGNLTHVAPALMHFMTCTR